MQEHYKKADLEPGSQASLEVPCWTHILDFSIMSIKGASNRGAETKSQGRPLLKKDPSNVPQIRWERNLRYFVCVSHEITNSACKRKTIICKTQHIEMHALSPPIPNG